MNCGIRTRNNLIGTYATPHAAYVVVRETIERYGTDAAANLILLSSDEEYGVESVAERDELVARALVG